MNCTSSATSLTPAGCVTGRCLDILHGPDGQGLPPRRSRREVFVRHPALRTAACALFGVRYPIVQTGMGWVSTPELTAATANAGGLGILAGATPTVAETEAAIARTRELTAAPFGANLRGDSADLSARAKLLIKHGVRVASFALAPNEA